MVRNMKKDKFWYQNKFEAWILANTPYKYAAYILPEVGIIDESALDDIISGRGYWANDAGCVAFPDEIALEEGGDEAQYGYIEFECDVPPDPDEEWINRVPFDDAFRIFEAGVEILLEEHPERREMVEAKMREARKTFDRLIARHEAWKKAHPEA